MYVFYTFPHNLWLLMLIPSFCGLAQSMEYLFILEIEYNLTKYEMVTMFIIHTALSYVLWSSVSSNIIVLFVIFALGFHISVCLYNLHLWHTRKRVVR